MMFLRNLSLLLVFLAVMTVGQDTTFAAKAKLPASSSRGKGPQVITLMAALAKALTNSETFTLFAPNDEAFINSGVSLESLSPQQLSEILSYHIIPGAKVLSSDLLPSQRVPTVQGSTLEVTSKKAVKVNGARVVFADILAAGGVIHVIDRLLLPPPTEKVLVAPSSSSSIGYVYMPTIVENAIATPALSSLVSVLTSPVGQPALELLSGAGPFTVFAPTNEALQAANIDVTDQAAVLDVLLYHVLDGAVFSGDLSSGRQSVPTKQGSLLSVVKNGQGVTINGDTRVVLADVESKNGVVHLIDRVLMPPPTTTPSIVENALATPELSVLAAVLQLPNYQPVLQALMGDGPFTVFAPTNDAFSKAGVDPNDTELVTEILKFHVVPGIAAYSTDLAPQQVVPTLQGSSLQVAKTWSGVTVNGVDVVIADVMSSNGVVHVIDDVLVPPTISQGSGSASGMPTSIESARLTIDSAIAEGAPLYDAGQRQECADIYEGTAVYLVGALPDGAPKEILQAAVTASAGTSTETKAWLLRHAFDSVLNSPMPYGTIVENALASSDLSTLVSVLTMPEYAPVLAALSGSGPFTVFAPTNAAFAAAGVDVSNVAAVTEVLKYHVVAGVAAYSPALASFQQIPTLEGSELMITTRGLNRVVEINGGATVVAADVLASNGVVHVIDEVLMPGASSTPVRTTSSVYGYPITVERAETIISNAISVGSPLFNQGDIQGCADTYMQAAQTLSSLLPPGAPKDIIDATLEAATFETATKQAWIFRSAFDAIRNSPMPSGSIVDNAIATPDLSTLVSVLTMPEYAPVLAALSGSGPFTVFAPTNAAFAAAGVDVSNVAAVTEVLKYHVVAGVAAYSPALASFQQVPTLEGSDVSVNTMSNNRIVRVNGADVVVPDVLASNGVVHVIDSVLTPPAPVRTTSWLGR